MDNSRSPGLSVLPMLVLAVAWSWAWWAVAIAAGGVETAAGGITYLVGGFGPTFAVVVALRSSSSAYRQSLRARLFRLPSLRWWAVAVALASGPKLIATAVAAVGGHEATGESIELVAVPVAIGFGLIAVSIEEPLWRGTALDASGSNLAKAGFLIGLVWAVWHAPLFAVDGTFQHDLGLWTADFWIFMAGVVGLSVILTWLVVASGGSILIALATHLAINLTGEFLPDDTTIRAGEMIAIWVVASVLYYRLWQTSARGSVLRRRVPRAA